MKQIETQSDLAINGAAPAFDKSVHVGRPNMGDKSIFFKYMEAMYESGWLTNNGPLVQEFEKKIQDFLGVKHCVAMCNGTIALEISIRALELKGEVIVPSFTFIATAHALHWQEITPVFADIDPNTHTLDPQSVRRMITPRTTGIIGVHLWGGGAPHAELQSIADEHNLKLMYDAAHAFGCNLDGQMIGNFGACEVLSFHATKFFNTLEGGAVVTNDEALAAKMRLMRNFGFECEDNVIHPGTNGKMIEACAAMGITNLDYLDTVIGANQRNYNAYREGIENIFGLELLSYDENKRNNYQYIVMLVGEDFPVCRDDIIAILRAENILARRYFWPGCHNMKPYRDLFPHARLMLPHTERIADQIIVLPTGVSVSLGDIDIIINLLRVIAKS